MTRTFTIWLVALAVMAALGTGTASAQDIYQKGGGVSTWGGAPNYPLISGFDSMEEDTTLWGQYGFWDENNDCRNQGPPCWDFYEGERDYALLFDYKSDLGFTDAPQGESAVYIDWSVFADNGWGGSSAFQHQLPDSVVAAGNYYDFSDFLEIGLDYNTQVPTTEGGLFRIKINEASDALPSQGMEDWYSESAVMLEDSPGWNEVFIPLDMVPGCCGTGGFNRPGWSGQPGNDFFDTDKIAGFQLEFVAPSSAVQGDSAIAGTVIWDNFRVRGVRYNLMSDFEGMPDEDGKQSNAGTYTLSTSDDAILGDGSLKVDYTIVGDQGWGGEVDLYWDGTESDGTFGNMSARTGVTVFYKVLDPASAPTTFGLRVHEAGGELFVSERTDVLTDESGQWRRYIADFSDMAGSVPSWCNCLQDGVIDQTQISRIQFVLYTAEGNTTEGSILFDRMTGYGFQETDLEAPEAPTGLAVSSGDYANIISWTDVPGEEDETYTIYQSQSPITDIAAEGVVPLASGIEGGQELYTHPLFYPVNDGPVTLYYAITARDAVGNVSEPAVLGAGVTTTAKGMPTIAIGGPPSFTADGDLGEWAGMTPFRMEVGSDFGFSVTDPGLLPINSAADLSADFWIAMDQDNMYIAGNVTDDVVDSWAGTGDPWTFDEFQLYFGLWDANTHYQTGGRGGAPYPDYEVSFNETEATGTGYATNPTPGDGIYAWTETSTGYIFEIMIPFSELAPDGADVFVPVEGMRIPLDVTLHDDDTEDGQGNQESMMGFSATNNNTAYNTVQNRGFTWIGAKYSVGVEQVSSDLPQQFNLHANYPNPFNPSTVFRYDLPESGAVTLRVFNVLGQEVRTLVDAVQAAGTYEVQFDASNLASGMYLYQLQSGSYIQTRKMMLIR